MPGHLERPLKGGEHRARELGELVRTRRVLDQDGEFVAAQARHQMAARAVPAGLGAVGEPRGDGGEQPVAGAVPQGVVDRLEAVDVQIAEADPAVRPALTVRPRAAGSPARG